MALFAKWKATAAETYGPSPTTNDKVEMDDEFKKLEKYTDVITALVKGLIPMSIEILLPDPATRARLEGMALQHPFPESKLCDFILKLVPGLDTSSQAGDSLVDVAETLKKIADSKGRLERSVQSEFLDPLKAKRDRELANIAEMRKKLEGARNDFDAANIGKPDQEDLSTAEKTLEQSIERANNAMFNLFSSEVEFISKLSAFAEAKLDHHNFSVEVWATLCEKLRVAIEALNAAPPKERRERVIQRDPKPIEVPSFGPEPSEKPARPPKVNAAVLRKKPSARGIYRFDAENEGELSFKEGEVINLIHEIDEDWYEVMNARGDVGFVPRSFLEIIVPL